MKINGVNVRGIKQAVGDYRRYNDTVIIFDYVTYTIECVGLDWYIAHINERDGDYLRYVNINELIKDVYNETLDVDITMSQIVAVLREYVI